MGRLRKVVTDRYRVLVPEDAFHHPSDDEPDWELGHELAINEARERTRLYCVPATWWAEVELRQPKGNLVAFCVFRRRLKD